MSTIYRASNSGAIIGRKGTISVAETPVAVTAAATATMAFEGVDPFAAGPPIHPGDSVIVTPRANLSGGIAIAAAWCAAANVIALKFINVGANASVAAQTMECVIFNDN